MALFSLIDNEVSMVKCDFCVNILASSDGNECFSCGKKWMLCNACIDSDKVTRCDCSKLQLVVPIIFCNRCTSSTKCSVKGCENKHHLVYDGKKSKCCYHAYEATCCGKCVIL